MQYLTKLPVAAFYYRSCISAVSLWPIIVLSSCDFGEKDCHIISEESLISNGTINQLKRSCSSKILCTYIFRESVHGIESDYHHFWFDWTNFGVMYLHSKLFLSNAISFMNFEEYFVVFEEICTLWTGLFYSLH